MKTVYTKQALKSALDSGESHVCVKGDFAKELTRKIQAQNSTRNAALGVGALAALGVLAAPFTFGASLGVTALTIGGVTISTAEVAILAAAGLAAYGIHKGMNARINKDGSVVIYK